MRDLIEECATFGALRQMFRHCEVGRLLNSKRGVGYQVVLARAEEKHGCVSANSCINCPLGRKALVNELSQRSKLYYDYSGALTILARYSVVGDRTLPRNCAAGESLRFIKIGLESVAIDSSAQDAILREADVSGCMPRTSCAQCSAGVDLLIQDLNLLSSDGMDAVEDSWGNV